MNVLRSFALTAVAATLVVLPATRAQGTLVWSDEFDGAVIDPANWEHMIGDGSAFGIPGWGNNELQYYTDRAVNSFVANGRLHIVALRENFGGRQYTSARLRTRGLRDFQYGRMEARIKLPRGQGIWPAFWMLPTNSPYGGWAASGEIDIVESINLNDEVHGTIHFGGPSPNNTSAGGSLSPGVNLSSDFHVYGIEWSADEIRWFYDGTLYFTTNSGVWFSSNGGSNNRAPFDNPFHFLLNIAVGGNWPGPPNGGTPFPQTMEVDWVRVYNLDTQSPFGPPTALPGRVEAERFDIGGAGVAFFDCDEENIGGAFRVGGVDIEPCSEGGFNVGWMCPNEWLEYTVNIAAAGPYVVRARLASGAGGGNFRLQIDGAPVTPQIAAPPTGGWQNWTSVIAIATLPAGQHILRFQNSASDGEYNINYFDILAPAAADLNVNGTVNFADAALLLDCLGGVSAPRPGSCQDPYDRADVDADDDVDLGDLAAFQRNYAVGL